MIKKFFGWLLDRLISFFRNEPDMDDIRSFVEEYYLRFQNNEYARMDNQADLINLAVLMADLDWLNQPQNVSKPKMEAGDQEWLALLKEKRIFAKGMLRPGSGKYLDLLDKTTRNTERGKLAAVMEKLLRHVEVKREKSFEKFTVDIITEQKQIERIFISILFSRTARRHHDLRFLNAALKMNEWYMKQMKSPELDKCTVRLLLALTEGELSARELLV